jgi:7-cyano-7-deazaguanine reductase
MTGYTREHAESGRELKLPPLETWENQYDRDYEIAIEVPEYTSICPKTKLPDFGTLAIRYVPKKLCIELKSLKVYLLAYRNVGIFYENAVNRICDDLARACRPKKLTVSGVFNTRGGMRSTITVSYPHAR